MNRINKITKSKEERLLSLNKMRGYLPSKMANDIQKWLKTY